MTDLKDLIDFCEAESIANKLNPTEESSWRYICRAYSIKFNTPLHIVNDLDPEKVALNYFESRLDDVEVDDHIEKILDAIYTLEDPNYDRQKDEELKEFIEQAELEEKERIANNISLKESLRKKSSKKSVLKKNKIEEENRPTGGSIDLSHLESEELNSSFEE